MGDGKQLRFHGTVRQDFRVRVPPTSALSTRTPMNWTPRQRMRAPTRFSC